MTCKVAIGKTYIVRHSMFETRDAAGSFQQYMPAMTEDAERLQQALLARASQPSRRCVGRVVAVALGVVVAVVAGFLV